MAIYEIQSGCIVPIKETSFSKEGLQERRDLQRLLRLQIDVISPETLVIAEEFSEWEESRRRIDLLGLDKDANLVVIELKSTDDGGHMELQAIRYAAMVSSMTFERAVEVYDDYLRRIGKEATAQESMLGFLEWDEPEEDQFAQDVRIVLVSADFSKEITTAVMWLNERDLDIRCMRMKPYKDNKRVLVDVQQVIPLPEAEEYMIGVRKKGEMEREDKGTRQYLRRQFWRQLLKRSKGRTELFLNVSAPSSMWVAAGSGVSGILYQYVIRKYDATVGLALEGERHKNKADFDKLSDQCEAIEEAFGGHLDWKRCDDLVKSTISINLSCGGYRSNPESWPEIQDGMIDTMIRLENALSPHILKLGARGQGSD